MAWYYSFTHKRGTEDTTTWQQRIRGLYPPDALFAEAGGLCVVAVAAVRRREDATHDNNQLPFDLTPESIALLVKESGRLLGNARLVWFEPWMLASLREGVADVARSQEGVVDALDSLKAQVAQVLRGTERGNMS